MTFFSAFATMISLVRLVGGGNYLSGENYQYLNRNVYTDSGRSQYSSVNYVQSSYHNDTYLSWQGLNASNYEDAGNSYYEGEFKFYDNITNSTGHQVLDSRFYFYLYYDDVAPYAHHFAFYTYSEDYFNLKCFVTFQFYYEGNARHNYHFDLDFSKEEWLNSTYMDTESHTNFYGADIQYWTFDLSVTLMSMDYDDFYNDTNYDQVYNEGKDEGRQIGYEEGYDVGREEGYQEGLSHGDYSFASLFGAIADTPVLVVRNLFNFDFFGVNLLGVILSLFTALILFFILRKLIK